MLTIFTSQTQLFKLVCDVMTKKILDKFTSFIKINITCLYFNVSYIWNVCFVVNVSLHLNFYNVFVRISFSSLDKWFVNLEVCISTET